MGSRSEYLPESFIKALRLGIPGFGGYPPRQQWHMAALVWQEGLQRREHRLADGRASFRYQELESGFGRGKFQDMNNALGIFDVSPNWWHRPEARGRQSATRAYALTDKVRGVKERYLKPRKDAVTRLMHLDGPDLQLKALQSIPNVIAPKQDDDPLGVTAKAWRNAKPLNAVPVDIDLLGELYSYLARMQKPGKQDQIDIFLRGVDAEELRRHIEWVGELIRLAHTDIAGRGYIIHRYAECKTGRLYAKGVSLQTAPRIIRKAALHGMFDYDVENCHYAIFDHLANRFGYEASAVRHYLQHKREVREGIAARVGIAVEQAKMCLLALMFGAKTTERPENAIPSEIGTQKAITLYKDREFAAIAADVREGRGVILQGWPKQRSTLLNDMGKRVGLREKPEVRMAHIIQGIEAKALRAAIDLYPESVVLLMHDGFVTAKPIDPVLVERHILDVTGIRLTLTGGVIDLPADLDFSKM